MLKFSFFKENKILLILACTLFCTSISVFHYFYNYNTVKNSISQFIYQNRIVFESADEFELFRKSHVILDKKIALIGIQINGSITYVGDRSLEESALIFRFSASNKSNTAKIIFFVVPDYLPTTYFSIFLFLILIIFVSTNYYDKKLREKDVQASQQMYNMSQKVAHDIRSPISTLNLISTKIQDEEVKYLQLAVVNQINCIANDLLTYAKTNQLHSTISEGNRLEKVYKRYLMRYSKNVSLVNDTSCPENIDIGIFWSDFEREYSIKRTSIQQKVLMSSPKDLHGKIPKKLSTILYRTLNNLVQNSIEATSLNGLIEISIKQSKHNKFEITVADNGKGIPDHVLQKIGKEKISYGKENKNHYNSGSGIALLSAYKDLAYYGCVVAIDSTINVGTKINIII